MIILIGKFSDILQFFGRVVHKSFKQLNKKLVYDDEIATGGTVYEQMHQCIEMVFLAQNIYAVVIHNKGEFNMGYNSHAVPLLKTIGVSVHASDSVESSKSDFSVTSLLADYLLEKIL